MAETQAMQSRDIEYIKKGQDEMKGDLKSFIKDAGGRLKILELWKASILGKIAGDVWSGQAVATGTAGWFRFYPNDRDNHTGADGGGESKIRFDGAVATSGAQLNMSNTAISSGGTTTIDSVAVTIPTA